MILDKFLQLVDNSAADLIAHTSGTQVLEGDVINFGKNRYLGEGNPLFVGVRVITSLTSGTSGAAVRLVLQQARNAAFTSNRSTSTVIIPDSGVDSITAGKYYEVAVGIDSNTSGGDQYFQLAWQGTQAHLASVTAGAISAWLGFQRGVWRSVEDYRG